MSQHVPPKDSSESSEDLTVEAPDLSAEDLAEDGKGQGEAVESFGAKKSRLFGRFHHEPDDYEFDADSVEETYGVAWTQNVRLVVAIVIVIVSAIVMWWFVW